jgi:hypothetical protein
MPIIEINEKLTRIIRGRSIELVTQKEGLVTILWVFRNGQGSEQPDRICRLTLPGINTGEISDADFWGASYTNPTLPLWLVKI